MQQLESTDRPLTIKEAAAFLSISVGTVRRIVRERRIPAYRPGGKVLYLLPEDLLNYVKSNRLKSRQEIDQEAAEYVRGAS